MKTFRIKEKYNITVWTYIKANSIEHAKEMIEDSDYEGKKEEINYEYDSTYWNSLEEVE